MLKRWTIQRAATVGIATGIAALLAISAIEIWPEGLLYAYVALLAVTIFCGVSILWITASDIRMRGTSGRMRPIRGFDIAIGLALLIPAAWGLRLIWPELNL
ncbi:MAG: hypothetical protein KF780_06770 [Sphingomonas sp.]|nr:hypothetical protein [Sphingomonas sp.]